MRPNLRHTAQILKNRLIHRQSRSCSDLTDSKPRAFGRTGEALFKDTAWEGLSLKSLLKDGCPSLRLSLLRVLKMHPVARDLADQLVVDVVGSGRIRDRKPRQAWGLYVPHTYYTYYNSKLRLLQPCGLLA